MIVKMATGSEIYKHGKFTVIFSLKTLWMKVVQEAVERLANKRGLFTGRLYRVWVTPFNLIEHSGQNSKFCR
jgi:hypothetical protein